MAVKQTVWIGDDNTFILQVMSIAIDGTESFVNFSGVYSVLLTLFNAVSGVSETEYINLTVGQVVDVSLGSGQIRLMLGQIPTLVVGEYQLRLRYKTSAGDTAPTQIVHESDAAMKVTVKVVSPTA